MLPDGNGYDLLTLYKERGIKTPVIYLTAVSDEGSIVKGLDLGADDYITKPFRNAELLSRVRAVIRRYDPVKEETGFVYRELVVDTNAATVKLSGEVIPLSSSEYKLLVYFLENQGICHQGKDSSFHHPEG